MNTLREAATMALEALEESSVDRRSLAAITALRAALAEPQTTHSTDCYKWHHECAIAEVQRLRAALAEPDTCTWVQDSDSDCYDTSCRHCFRVDDGTPDDNGMKWCCFCGKRLVQDLWKEGDDE